MKRDELSASDSSRENPSSVENVEKRPLRVSTRSKNFKLRNSSCAQTLLLSQKHAATAEVLVWSPPLPRALKGLLAYQEERRPSPLWVFIMLQCCKITGFPQCFLLFVRLCHGNLERVHVGDSGLSCVAPHSGIHDVSGSRAKAFLRLLSDSSAQEVHCRAEEMTVGACRRGRYRGSGSQVRLQDPPTGHFFNTAQCCSLLHLGILFNVKQTTLKSFSVLSQFKWSWFVDVEKRREFVSIS